MSKLTEEAINALAELNNRATPAPWATQNNSNGGRTLLRGNDLQDLVASAQLPDGRFRHPQSHLQIVPTEDAVLIAMMRNALPELLEELLTARSRITLLKVACEDRKLAETQLRKVIADYGRHDRACQVDRPPSHLCTCGFQAALDAVRVAAVVVGRGY